MAGRLGDIAERARRAGVRSPAVLLVGPTVAAASAPQGRPRDDGGGQRLIAHRARAFRRAASDGRFAEETTEIVERTGARPA